MNNVSDSQRLMRLAVAPRAREPARRIFRFGVESLDRRLDGKMPVAALHEIFAAATSDAASASAFALILALLGEPQGPIFWVRDEGAAQAFMRPFAPGLVGLGIDPATVLSVNAPSAIAALRAGADIARCNGVGAVVIEPRARVPQLDLTASRRLALAAEQSGVMVLLLRLGAEPVPSAAYTRWQVSSAPSLALEANAPGLPAFDISLLRHRGGIAGIDARLEWDRDRLAFGQPPLSGGVPAAASSGADRAIIRRAA